MPQPNYKSTLRACCLGYVTQAAVVNLAPLLFVIFQNRYGLSFDCREKFFTGLERLKRERVDVPLGNHVQCNDTLCKAARIGSDTGNPFIAPEEWIPFLDACAERLRKQIAAEQESRPV